jgi:hypothetical protein
MYRNILQSNIPDIDARLGHACSSRVKGIEHAPWAASQGLFLLLGAQIYCPPDRFVHVHVFVDDVFYLTAATVARVGLDVNTFERFLEICVSKRNIPNTVVLRIRRHTAN